MKNSLSFETHPSLIDVDYVGSDVVKVQIHGDMAVNIDFDNDVMLSTGGDFIIAAKGEIDLISKDNPICFESINSEIHLNSRNAKPIKGSKESLEYKQKQLEYQKSKTQNAEIHADANQTWEDRLTELENQVNYLTSVIAGANLN